MALKTPRSRAKDSPIIQDPQARAVMDRLRELAASCDALMNAMSPRMRMNHTDMLTLDLLGLEHTMTAGRLAGRLKLTTGAITGVLDRLEQAGHVVRGRDAADRRKVLVQLTAEARRSGLSAFRPLAEDFLEVIDQYSDGELKTIERFIGRVSRLYADHADRLSKR